MHRDLDAATRAPGKTGNAARTVVRILQPHFLRENDFATPPLGLLRRLADGRFASSMAEVVVMMERLKTELPFMHQEHTAIAGALEEFRTAASDEGQAECVQLADRLLRHAAEEEEILYPAAIVVGEYVKLRLETEERRTHVAGR
jgi:hypothetical protein